jgi:regulator of sigma E protease
MTILFAILLFGFLIFIHELGHFIFAKLSGVRVLTFSLGFGPKLIGKKIGDTEYLISALPLGGYVKMAGEDPEDKTEGYKPEQLYKNQPVYKRASIIFAGSLFNFLTAVVIFFFIFLVGAPALLPVIGEVMPDTPAERAALLKGDRILEIDGEPLRDWAEMTRIIQASADKTINMKVQRDSEIFTVSVTPDSGTVKNIFGEDIRVGLIGVKHAGETTKIREGIAGSVEKAFLRTWEISSLTVTGIIKLIQRILPADTIGGPILIFQLAERQAEAGALHFFVFAAVISINLAILNLLPIPVLDGGHLLFLGIEAVRGKPVSEKTMAIAQRVGIAFILALMMLAFYNDIVRIITGTPIP